VKSAVVVVEYRAEDWQKHIALPELMERVRVALHTADLSCDQKLRVPAVIVGARLEER